MFAVNEHTGEITTTTALLDRDANTQYTLLVVPTDGSPRRHVRIEITMGNNSAPKFALANVEVVGHAWARVDPRCTLQIEIAENARMGAEFTLPIADDGDAPPNNVQGYRIVSGNVNGVLRLRERYHDTLKYVDLVVGGRLDREYRDHYELRVEAFDGGEPPRFVELPAWHGRVKVAIADRPHLTCTSTSKMSTTMRRSCKKRATQRKWPRTRLQTPRFSRWRRMIETRATTRSSATASLRFASVRSEDHR